MGAGSMKAESAPTGPIRLWLRPAEHRVSACAVCGLAEQEIEWELVAGATRPQVQDACARCGRAISGLAHLVGSDLYFLPS